MLTSTTPQTVEISTGPPNYIRPAFPKHAATSPIPLQDLLPDNLKSIFSDSEPEGNNDVKVVDMQPAHLLTTAQHPDETILSKTEPETNDEVTIVSFWPAAGPSAPMALPLIDLSETEPESDKEPQPATVSNFFSPSLIANKQSRPASILSSLRNPEVFCLAMCSIVIFLVTHLTVPSLSSCHSCLS